MFTPKGNLNLNSNPESTYVPMKIRSNFEGSKVVVQIEVLYGFISLYAEGPFGIQKLGRYNSHIIFN